MTKKEKFDVIANVFATVDVDTEVRDEILAFCENEVAALDRRNAKAKETAAKKRTESDALKDTIEGMLSEEPITVNDILDRLGDETLTPAKIVARMTQLVKVGKANKTNVKVDGRKLVGYVLA